MEPNLNQKILEKLATLNYTCHVERYSWIFFLWKEIFPSVFSEFVRRSSKIYENIFDGVSKTVFPISRGNFQWKAGFFEKTVKYQQCWTSKILIQNFVSNLWPSCHNWILPVEWNALIGNSNFLHISSFVRCFQSLTDKIFGHFVIVPW